MNDYFETEQWRCPDSDERFLKIRVVKPDGTKRGIILIVDENELDEVPEGSCYRKIRLKSKG